jgi:hypothetical protein
MMRYRRYIGVAAGLIIIGMTLAWADDNQSSRSRLVSENALLVGLEGNTVFPFIDTTPNTIRRAHIALTDSTTTCAPGAAAPLNMQILVGEAGVALVPVMTAETNTGIFTRPDQCVFHTTVRPGVGGVPRRVTDIVVVNSRAAPLTGIHTVTVSAEVQ